MCFLWLALEMVYLNIHFTYLNSVPVRVHHLTLFKALFIVLKSLEYGLEFKVANPLFFFTVMTSKEVLARERAGERERGGGRGWGLVKYRFGSKVAQFY